MHHLITSYHAFHVRLLCRNSLKRHYGPGAGGCGSAAGGGGWAPLSPGAGAGAPPLPPGGPALNTCSTTVLKELH